MVGVGVVGTCQAVQREGYRKEERAPHCFHAQISIQDACFLLLMRTAHQ